MLRPLCDGAANEIVKATMCDGGHFGARPRAVGLRMDRARTPRTEVKMARAVKVTKTRLARWIKTFREGRYYARFE
jgi:hypothetical protein